MRFRFYYGDRPQFSEKDIHDFDRGKYECRKLMRTRRGSPVVISQSKDPAFPVWKVEYDYSCMFFQTYSEALAFCKGRFSSTERRD